MVIRVNDELKPLIDYLKVRYNNNTNSMATERAIIAAARIKSRWDKDEKEYIESLLPKINAKIYSKNRRQHWAK